MSPFDEHLPEEKTLEVFKNIRKHLSTVSFCIVQYKL